MNSFTKQEIKIIFSILTILFVITGLNMATSLRRGRDNVRKDDISAIQKAIDVYYQKYYKFPDATEDGKIIGCFDEEPQVDKLAGFPINVVTCLWGESSFENIKTMPRDPKYLKGASYKYVSDGQNYMFYISLEGDDEAEYTQSIVDENLQCGTKICNYGRGI